MTPLHNEEEEEEESAFLQLVRNVPDKDVGDVAVHLQGLEDGTAL